MHTSELLAEAYGRIGSIIAAAVKDLTPEQLAYRVTPDANSIAWLVWHLTRIQDDHIAGVAGTEQIWIAEGWKDQFGLPFDALDHGYGHSTEDVGRLQGITAERLTGYYAAVSRYSMEYLGGVSDEDLDTVVDRRWDPPVTMAVRLISVLSDNVQHAGQAAYIRGLLPG